MAFKGFTEADFNVFRTHGLEPRMKALVSQIRPKLEDLGDYFAPVLTAMTGDEFFPHVAKHARRSVNPPIDTWVAFSHDKRGYKKHPHFQIGLWEDGLFIWFAIINEAVNKEEYAHKLMEYMDEIKTNIPDHFVWSTDHTKPGIFKPFDPEYLNRLERVKKAEILCGLVFSRDEVVKRQDLIDEIEQAFKALTPLYEWITKSAVM